jgi:hypothetical protein
MNSAHEADFSDSCSYVDLYAVADGRVKPRSFRSAEEEKRIRHDITRRAMNNRRGQRSVQAVKLSSPVEKPRTNSNGERGWTSTQPVQHPRYNRTLGRASTLNISQRSNRACGTSIPLEVFVAKHDRLQTQSLHSEKTQTHHNKLHDGQEIREGRTHLSTRSRSSSGTHSISNNTHSCQPLRKQRSSHSRSRRNGDRQSRPPAESRGSSDKVGHHSSQSPSSHCVSDKSRRIHSHRSGDIRREIMVADKSPTINDESQSPPGGTRQCRTAPRHLSPARRSCRSVKERSNTVSRHQQSSRSLDDVEEIQEPKPAYLSLQLFIPMNLERVNKQHGRSPPRRLLRAHKSCPSSMNERSNALSGPQSSRSLDSRQKPSRPLDDVDEIRTPKPSKVVGRKESNAQNLTASGTCHSFSLGKYF